MLFNSLGFLLFFPVVCLIYFVIPKKFQYIWLLCASYWFYMGWNAKYALLLLFSTLVTWICGLTIGYLGEKEISDRSDTGNIDYKRLKQLAVAVNFILTLSILFLYKYFDFAVYSLNRVLSVLNFELISPRFDVLLPVGISFYTFQALGYSMDVYRGEIKVEKNFLRYALFVSFFPQLVAGPIERSKNLLKQVYEEHAFDYDRMRDGLLIMLWGYFLKIVIADRAAMFVDTVYGDIDMYGGWYLIIASLLFAVQIYCDFSGYSTIALGAAKIMGFELMENFRYPYLSGSIAVFWRNWHISLTSWFKDYLYIPLGGNKKGKIRKYANIMIVFLVSGLWHGASWHYVIWGGINGFYQVAGEVLRPVRTLICSIFHLRKESMIHKILSVLGTFILVDIAWVFFRAGAISQAIQILQSMISAHNAEIFFNEALYTAGLSAKNFKVLILAIMVLLGADIMKYKNIEVQKKIVSWNVWIRWPFYMISIMFVLIFGIWGPAFEASNFIYFQF